MKVKKVQFQNYKSFKDFTVPLSDFDVLVGPNNSGKSTILGVFRILSEGIRKANSFKAEKIEGPAGVTWGHTLDLHDIPVSLDNVFYNYDEGHPALIRFFFDDDKKLLLYFPERGLCYFIPEKPVSINTPALFKRHYPVKISFVPVLGPVEYQESVYQKEAARKALLTHRASRNFRNIWYHYSSGFEEFREMIKSTWPGMDINPPELAPLSIEKPSLVMFCPEDRIPREIYWAGFGFQVWCQMLTFILQSKGSDTLIIDEPDIYLHSDLQRQLVSILKNLGIQVIIATHAIEIITEVDAKSLLMIHKKRKTATKISNPKDLQYIYQLLGSNANPTLTQLAKTKRALFLEGKDFQLLSMFSRKLKNNNVANRSDFAVIPVEGFNPQKVIDFSKGIEMTLGMTILKGVIFDRDYRSDEESETIKKKLKDICFFITIHNRKEIENFLLEPDVLDRLIRKLITERHNNIIIDSLYSIDETKRIIEEITASYKTDVMSQYLSHRRQYNKNTNPRLHETSVDSESLRKFDEEWEVLDSRLRLVPGKDFLSKLNNYLQNQFKISFTQNMIVNEFRKEELDNELIKLILDIDKFSKMSPPQ